MVRSTTTTKARGRSRWLRRLQRGDAGAAVVEFALVVPVLFLIVFAVIDFGRALWTQNVLASAAREGARAGAVQQTPALAQTVAGQTKSRFVGVFFPHGMGPGHWEPEVEGALPDKMPYILESLEGVKDQTVVLNGLWSQSAEPPEGTTGSDHWVAAAFLTAIKPRKTAGSDATVGSACPDRPCD